MKKYTVSDGKLILTLEEAEEGGFIVTSPMDPELTTEADTVGEAFFMARDALKLLAESRRLRPFGPISKKRQVKRSMALA